MASWKRRASDWLTNATERYRSGRERVRSSPLLMPILGAFLLLFAYLSWRALDLAWTDINWWLIALSGALVLPTTFLSAAEFWLSARAVGQEAGWRQSLEVTIAGSVANLLPVPGSTLVRVEALSSGGARVTGAVRTTAGIGFTWVGLSLLGSGTAIALAERPAAGVGLVVVGAITTIAGLAALVPATASPAQVVAGVVAVELATIGLAVARIWLVLAALGTDPTGLQALGLVASGAVASATGLVPGGLGVREALTGLLAPLVGLPAASGFLTATINRVVTLVVQAPVALALGVRRG